MRTTGHRYRKLLLEKRTARCRVVKCGCGLTSVSLGSDGHARGSCDVCGEFGYYPRLFNAKFASEQTGQDINRRRDGRYEERED